jgi:hypothetical protein
MCPSFYRQSRVYSASNLSLKSMSNKRIYCIFCASRSISVVVTSTSDTYSFSRSLSIQRLSALLLSINCDSSTRRVDRLWQKLEWRGSSLSISVVKLFSVFSRTPLVNHSFFCQTVLWISCRCSLWIPVIDDFQGWNSALVVVSSSVSSSSYTRRAISYSQEVLLNTPRNVVTLEREVSWNRKKKRMAKERGIRAVEKSKTSFDPFASLVESLWLPQLNAK